MDAPLTVRVRPDVADFLRAQAEVENRSVDEVVEALVLREKARRDERKDGLTVQADPALLKQDRHELLRDDDEHAARTVLFEALLHHARAT